MNKFLFILLLIAAAFMAWLNRDEISKFFAHKTETAAEPTPEAKAPATPNPAAASTELAKRTYPALAVQGSPFNIRFVAKYNQLKASNPDFFVQADWPMQLAAQTAKEFAVPTPTSAALVANQHPSSLLDARPLPPGATPGTPTPGLKLPGLQGSSLDAPARCSRTR